MSNMIPAQRYLHLLYKNIRHTA